MPESPTASAAGEGRSASSSLGPEHWFRFCAWLGASTRGFDVQIQTSKNSGYRTFLDGRGRLWEVWMVHPSSIERRKMERRSPVENAVFLIEQRVLGDRRTQVGTRGNVASEYSNGWLCFASNGEKRRLAPVPVNWMSANDSQVA